MEGMAELNRDTDGFIQLAGRKCSFSHTFFLDVSHPFWLRLPCCRGHTQEKLNQRGTRGRDRWVGQESWEMGRMERDGEDETRQGRTLPQQGVRRRVNRVMPSTPKPLPISSHYYFIPPSLCTSHPHFAFFWFLCCAPFRHIFSEANQARHRRN